MVLIMKTIVFGPTVQKANVQTKYTNEIITLNTDMEEDRKKGTIEKSNWIFF